MRCCICLYLKIKRDGLKPEIVNASRRIIAVERLKNPRLKMELEKRPGHLSDWGKYSTDILSSPSGNFEVHFYYNPVTGDAYYGMDFKVKFQHNGTWSNIQTIKFDLEPVKYTQ